MSREPKRGTSERGYGWRWQQARRRFLMTYPLCGMRPGGQPPVMSACHRDGIATAAEVVDHVVPHRGDQRLFWDERDNWQAQCRRCHAVKTKAGL